MFFENVCNSCGGAGRRSVSMVEFVEVAIAGLGVPSYGQPRNKIKAIQNVRQLAKDNHLEGGLRDSKIFVEALMTFERQLRGEVPYAWE